MTENKREKFNKARENYANKLATLFSNANLDFVPEKIATRITLIYLLLGGLWIITSDRLLNFLVDDKGIIAMISIIKGWVFVIATGIIIYLLTIRPLNNIKTIQKKLIISNEELAATFEELEASYEGLSLMEEELKIQYGELLMNQEQLKRSEERYRVVSESSNAGIWEYDFVSGELFFSDRYPALLGFDLEEIHDMADWEKIIHPEDIRLAVEPFNYHLENHTDSYDAEYRMKCKDGTYKWMHVRAKAIFNKKGQPLRITGSHIDISKLVEYQERLQNLAYNDSMTGLPNRLCLYEKMDEDLKIHEKNKTSCAVLFIDTDNFKLVNDSLGHSFGDRLIIEVGKRLSAFANENSTLFRLGGDEMIFYVTNVHDEEQVEDFAQRILASFKKPYNVEGNIFHITVSIGISMYPKDGDSVDQLLKNADMAMYRAKEKGKNGYFFFNTSLKEELENKIKMETNLRNAIDNHELLLYYQPKVDVRTGQINGFEALARWKSPELGMVPPGQFIGTAEETGLIVPMGEWVLKTAAGYIKDLNLRKRTNYKVSVNISVIQLMQDRFNEMVLHTLEETGLSPQLLELEVTESNLLDSRILIDKLIALREKGISIALDDFGKGYSSLSYLRQLPITTLKIDKTFIDDIFLVGPQQSITESIITIGHKSGLIVVAEGVETSEQLDYLVSNNCDIIQGYIYGRPLPPVELEEVYLK